MGSTHTCGLSYMYGMDLLNFKFICDPVCSWIIEHFNQHKLVRILSLCINDESLSKHACQLIATMIKTQDSQS